MVQLTDLQERTAKAIVNVFETSKVLGDYGKAVVLPGDAGHLSYGRSQACLGKGSLHLLIASYCAAPSAQFAVQLNDYLDRLENKDVTLDYDQTLRGLLEAAGNDPVMHSTQDRFFDVEYWDRAVKSADYIKAQTPLACAIAYDAWIQGTWHALRDRTNEAGLLETDGEAAWFARYVDRRQAWLAASSDKNLRNSVYRMESFRDLMAKNNWTLALPLTVHKVTITEAALNGTAAAAASTLPVVASPVANDGPPVLKFKTPHMRGDAVTRLQRALVKAGFALKVDSDFGTGTHDAVCAFQRRERLKDDGIVGPATWAELEPNP